jgi:16S rRNA (uracil1498-N3)-methyltransferase
MHKEEHALFYITSVSGNKAFLTKEEYRHARLALRIGNDATVYATDGNGIIYKCILGEPLGEGGEVEIIEAIPNEPIVPAVHLYIGFPEREPFEEMLTSLAALGVARIVPVVCEYCQVQWWSQWEKRLERMQRKMIAGIKQSHNPRLPGLSSPQSFREAYGLTREGPSGVVRMVADPRGAGIEKAFLGTRSVERIDCFIGPPGGFSPEELKLFSEGGFQFIRIAHYRLRTELAVVVTCSAIMQRFIGENTCP